MTRTQAKQVKRAAQVWRNIKAGNVIRHMGKNYIVVNTMEFGDGKRIAVKRPGDTAPRLEWLTSESSIARTGVLIWDKQL